MTEPLNSLETESRPVKIKMEDGSTIEKDVYKIRKGTDFTWFYCINPGQKFLLRNDCMVSIEDPVRK